MLESRLGVCLRVGELEQQERSRIRGAARLRRHAVVMV
jgi:hypothetical protein